MTDLPDSYGDAMRLIGRYLAQPTPASMPPTTLAAHADLAAAHQAWVAAGSPDHAPGAAFHARGDDPDTSHQAADRVEEREGGHHVVREGTHKARLLIVYGRASRTGRYLSDHQAAEEAGLGAGGWKRCSDLRAGGFIRSAGERPGPHGTPVMVCEATEAGLARWAELDIHAPRNPPPPPAQVSLL